MRAILPKIQVFLKSAVGILVLGTILIVTVGVISRLAMVPAAWTDEMLRIIFVWLVFIMSAVGYHCDELIGLELVEDGLKNKPLPRKLLKLFQALAGVVFAFFMAKQTFVIVSTQLNTREELPVTHFPLWGQTFGYFLGCLILCVFAVYKLYTRIRALKRID